MSVHKFFNVLPVIFSSDGNDFMEAGNLTDEVPAHSIFRTFVRIYSVGGGKDCFHDAAVKMEVVVGVSLAVITELLLFISLAGTPAMTL